MAKNSEEEKSPENFAKMYISMTSEQKEQFWKMFAEEIKRYNERQQDFDNTD